MNIRVPRPRSLARQARNVAICAAGLIAGAVATASLASAQDCRELWIERNSIYKEAGYCFKTDRAISYFGNAGCSYESEEDLPLSPYQRRRISEIRGIERDMGCR